MARVLEPVYNGIHTAVFALLLASLAPLFVEDYADKRGIRNVEAHSTSERVLRSVFIIVLAAVFYWILQEVVHFPTS